ncbi:hypothetical protein JCGZ_20781 [Jatropha curcas]|uniref:Peptidase A1 domain-containing protein n=1 Tax=Jatropha curcas TaxID=180498 RepID=A0A067K054_JATCU|nr:hypothetical protein JCGZ_20781 [Jatropha curcas]
MDTGSTVTWIQCKRCQLCARQEIPFYDDRTSSTYKNISCQDPSCVKECDDSGHCIYQIAYMDGTMSRGRLGREQFAFETRDEGIVAVDDVVFGCGLSNSMTIPGLGSGIFGLGYSSISIVHRLGRKFSYCIGDIDDPSYSYNQLKLGEDVDIEGDSTPFELRYGLYFITLEWISIGQERLDIDPDVFEKIQDRGGVVIDSGTELTVLPQAAYDKIANKVHNLLDRFLKPYWADVGTYKRLCYYGNMNRDLKGFPATTFQFSDGAELELEFRALFHIVAEGEFCLWLAPFNISDVEGFSIIGIFAQQNYNVAYDIDKRRIYFQRIECQLLED